MGLVATDAFVPGGMPTFQEAGKEASYAFVMTLTMVNWGINPIIYSLKHPGFKENCVECSEERYHPCPVV